jgi:DNA-binding winged helix-turn-helix (wHTH) protein
VRYAFGECILDSDTRQLTRGGRVRHLGPKAYELLQVLITARPRVIGKVEIFDRVWPGTSVTESSLSTVMAELREALGDTVRIARYVRTVYGFGYAFVAKVTTLDSGEEQPLEPSLGSCVSLSWGDRRVDLVEGVHLIGRSADVRISIDDPAVSRHHARVTVSRGVVTLEDLGSRNGTWRNGERLSAVALVAHGDSIGVGPIRLRVAVQPGGAETLAASGLDPAAHHPAAVDDNRLAGDVAARR